MLLSTLILFQNNFRKKNIERATVWKKLCFKRANYDMKILHLKNLNSDVKMLLPTGATDCKQVQLPTTTAPL